MRYGTQQHYDQKQREAWAPTIPDTAAWTERLRSVTTFVAEDDSGIAGFMTLGSDGYIDLAFVRPDVIGQGVAYQLYRTLERAASRSGLARLYTEASDVARPFFERQGWRVAETQTVNRSGVSLTNHRMEKLLE